MLFVVFSKKLMEKYKELNTIFYSEILIYNNLVHGDNIHRVSSSSPEEKTCKNKCM
jgi:hypothetical protein